MGGRTVDEGDVLGEVRWVESGDFCLGMSGGAVDRVWGLCNLGVGCPVCVRGSGSGSLP